MKNCATCGKGLPEDYRSEQCSLCAIGLRPTTDFETNAPANVASGRKLADIECPTCLADLSDADISKRSCSICGSQLPAYIVDLAPIRPDDPLLIKAARESGSQVRHWPKDAPLW